MTETSEEPTPDGSMPSAVPDAEQLASRFEADGVLLYLIDGQELSIVDIWPPHASAGTLKLQVGFGVTGLVARTRKPVLINADSPRNALHRRLLRLEPRQTVARMCVPLPGLEGEMVGVLAVHRSPDRPFDQADLDDAESLAALLGLQLHANRLWRAVSRHRTEARPPDRAGHLSTGGGAPADRLRSARRGHDGARVHVVPSVVG